MNAITHLLNIGTLAAWLSVAGFGTVAVVYPGTPVRMPVMVVGETMLLPDDFVLGGETSEAPSEEAPDTAPLAVREPLPTPPDLPEIAETKPLPLIPAFPAIAENPKPAVPRQPSRAATPGTGKPAAASSGMSKAARIAAGRFPKPDYPIEARRKGLQGTVHVIVTIGNDGRVISAVISSPSPYPLLNSIALKAARSARFPPGPIITLPPKPYVFNLK